MLPLYSMFKIIRLHDAYKAFALIYDDGCDDNRM